MAKLARLVGVEGTVALELGVGATVAVGIRVGAVTGPEHAAATIASVPAKRSRATPT
jgi:hypothetical protein